MTSAASRTIPMFPLTLEEAAGFVSRVIRAANADREEPGYVTQNTVDRLAQELVDISKLTQ